MLNHLVADDSGRYLLRPAHQQRYAEGAFPVGVLLAAEGRLGAIGPGIHMRPVVGGIHDEGVFGEAELVEMIEQLTDVLVVVDHGVVIRGLVLTRLPQARGLGVCAQMHVGGVHPAEKRLASLLVPRDEVLGGGDDLIVYRLHEFARQGTGVFDLLLANAAPARLLGRIVLVGRPAAQYTARQELRSEALILRVVGILPVGRNLLRSPRWFLPNRSVV